MGAWSLTVRKQGVTADGRRSVDALISGAASYATGGDTINHTLIGLKSITSMVVFTQDEPSGIVPVTPGGHDLRLTGTPTARTIAAYVAAGTEVPAATNMSGKQFAVRFIGTAT